MRNFSNNNAVRLAGWFLGLACGAANVLSQSTVSGRPCEGQNGFVIRDAATGQVVSRGWTTTDGTLGDGVVLGANRSFIMTVASGMNGTVGTVMFNTGNNGSTMTVPRTQVGSSIDRDSDGDGITDEIEDVFGTDPRNPSTFGSGIRDNVIATTPPPPGTPVGSGIPNIQQNPAFGPPGIINGVLLPGTAVDVSAFNDTVAVASLDRGVTIFNVFGGTSPRQIAQIDTPGDARAVGLPFDDLAVADGPAGLAIVDLREPASARIRVQVRLGSFAESVATAGGIAYAGLRNGQLAVVDISSGTEVQRLNLGGEVFDVAVAGDFVFAIAGNDLRAFSTADGNLMPAGRIGLSAVGADSRSMRKRLFVGGGWAQATTLRGFDTIDVRNPAAMALVGRVPATGPGSFKQIVANGSGLGVAAVGTTPGSDGTHDISLYNLGATANVTDLITILNTPGTAYANTIYNGLDYVADGERGLQVLRYLETDRRGIAPTIVLDSSAIGGQAEEGKLFRVTASAADDVQVRNVDFILDGQQIATDGNFPFEFFFNTPQRTPATTTFTVRARAFDTGGNSTWSAPFTVNLTSDATPPRILSFQPAPSTILGSVNTVIAFFSEPLQSGTVTPESFFLVHSGADALLGTPDDLPAPPGSLMYQDSLRAAVWSFPSPLPPGHWHATVRAPIADRTGNVLPSSRSWNFFLFSETDRDGDGVPDALETTLSLDPDNPDTRGDGVRDGDRDFDNDGLRNAWEVYWKFDPRNARSRNAMVLDGDLDLDLDSLLNRSEQLVGANPMLPDTDFDGWNDETEFTAGSDPLDPASRPKFLVQANPPIRIVLPVFAAGEGIARGVTIASPPVSISVPALTSDDLQFGTFMANPPVSIGLASVSSSEGSGLGIVMGQPIVRLALPALGTSENRQGTTLALPPVRIRIP